MLNQIKNLINLFSKKNKCQQQDINKLSVPTNITPLQLPTNINIQLDIATSDSAQEVKCAEQTIIESSNQAPDVITFEERKKICIPSQRGLYVAEILLLHYCDKGNFPNPKFGYQQFWWFEYGIDDVDFRLNDLCTRGYIELETVKNSIHQLTIPTLKNILKNHASPISGKKDDLVNRVAQIATDEELLFHGVTPKYKLTTLGKEELNENLYIPYMHQHSIFSDFNVWSVNKELGNRDKSNWFEYIQDKFEKYNQVAEDNYQKTIEYLDKCFPEEKITLKMQDDQLKKIQKADEKYFRTDNLKEYIAFWENIWTKEGLLFEGASWHYKLADLYIKAGDYSKALEFINKINNLKPQYSNKAEYYISTIQKLIAKENKQQKK